MAPRNTDPRNGKALSPREAAEYTQDILMGLEKLAHGNSHGLLAHLLDMARKEALYLSKK